MEASVFCFSDCYQTFFCLLNTVKSLVMEKLVMTDIDDSGLRGEITSICRETAKTFDMTRNGSRWKCEVTEVKVSDEGVKKYGFYVNDKISDKEYQAEALIENRENAEWKISEVN